MIKTKIVVSLLSLVLLSGCVSQDILSRLELVEETARQAISAADANSHRLNQMFYEQQKK